MRNCFKVFILLGLLLSFSAFAEEQAPVRIEGDLQVPENYSARKKALQERDQVIPMKASEATSPGSFSSHILQYHFADVLENTKMKPLKSVKSFEKSVNKASVDSKFITIKPKLDVNRLKAELDIDTFVHAKVWTEDSFKTLRAQMKLYEIENNHLSLENKSNHEDTRTYLNLERTW